MNLQIPQKKKKKNEIIYKCSICKNKESICFCIHCNILLCIECKETINIDENGHKIIIIKNNEIEKAKKLFLNSISFLIKNILKKCNYLIKQENNNIKKLNEFDSKSNLIIKKVFKYPSITDFNDFNSHLNFLIDINSILIKEILFTNKEFSLGSFHISEMDTCITINL